MGPIGPKPKAPSIVAGSVFQDSDMNEDLSNALKTIDSSIRSLQRGFASLRSALGKDDVPRQSMTRAQAMADEYARVRDVAKILNQSGEQVRRLCKCDELAYRRPGRSYLILVSSVDAYLKAHPMRGASVDGPK